MDTGFSRVDAPGYLMRIAPGPNPSETALTEVYLRKIQVRPDPLAR